MPKGDPEGYNVRGDASSGLKKKRKKKRRVPMPPGQFKKIDYQAQIEKFMRRGR